MSAGAMTLNAKLQFSGHETFPLRYGWLKKVYDAVRDMEQNGLGTQSVFHADDAIGIFGVGKNMVAAMRHWALASGVLEPVCARSGHWQTTALGRHWLDDSGWDPWLEDPASLWLLHWQFASTPARTSTWYWVFNHCPHTHFDRPLILEHLMQLCHTQGMKRVANSTLKRDVECFIRTYAARFGAVSREESLECPLSELTLLVAHSRERFQLARGPKPTLSRSMFAYAAIQFWQRHYRQTRTMAFETLMHEPGSPGRVFQLDEDALMDLVMDLEVVSEGSVTWSETAGLRQLICLVDPGAINLLSLLARQYAVAS